MVGQPDMKPMRITVATDGASDAAASSSQDAAGGRWQLAARIVLSLGLFAVGLYMLSNYVRALIWAVVLAIALWPLYERARQKVPAALRGEVLPLVFAAIIGFVFLVPFAALIIEAVREFHQIVDFGKQAEQSGVPVPDVVQHLPYGAKQATDWWNAHLAQAGWAKEALQHLNTESNREVGRNLGENALHRLILLFFAIVTLFFLFKDGESVLAQAAVASHKLFGHRGEKVGRQMIASIHGTVNGLVLVGIGEGLVLGLVYVFAKVPHPILFGVLTGIAAMIPFAAAVAIGLAALALLAAGGVVAALVVVGAGFLVTFTADHFVRPGLIGGTTKLPFLWVLLGILGGVETFRLLGLFVGPAIMAALMLLWRELAGSEAMQEKA